MTIEKAKKLLNCSKQSWYYYKKTGLIHIKDYQVDDDESVYKLAGNRKYTKASKDTKDSKKPIIIIVINTK